MGKGKSKRKIAIEKLDCPKARSVCFTKRRQGLFKKSAELSRLHNLRIAAVAFSPAGTPFEFGNNAPLLFDRYIAAACNPSSPSVLSSSASDSALGKYNISEINALLNVDVSKMTVSELKDYSNNLEKSKSLLLTSLQENQRDDSQKADDSVGNNEIHSDEFTFQEIVSKIMEDDHDCLESKIMEDGPDCLDFQFHNFELAEKKEEFEAMLREFYVAGG